MPNNLIMYMFLLIFFITAIVTILAISNLYPFNAMENFYKKSLFSALLLELVAIVLAAARLVFLNPGGVEHYVWQIVYPDNLRQQFEDVFLKDKLFADFYQVNKNKGLFEIQDDKRSKFELERLLDSLFVIKKADEFAGKTAEGEMFLIRDAERKSTNFGKAVLTFPGETQPIAFGVTGQPEIGSSWHLSFSQPDRYVQYEGRINRWRGGNLDIDFNGKEGLSWSGDLNFNGVKVGHFTLAKRR
jgi:hypothetical protein